MTRPERAAPLVAAVLALALTAAAGDPLDVLRSRRDASASQAARLRESGDEGLRQRDEAEKTLEEMKTSLEKRGGFFAERRVRAQSVAVRRLVEESLAAAETLRQAEAKATLDREELRDALFSAASERTSAADLAAREGRRGDAMRLNVEAAAMLSEAAPLASAAETDPWRGLDGEIPLTRFVDDAERAAVADAYRHSAEIVATRLAELAPRLAAAEKAVAAWNYLSRYRGVLERAGGVPADPTLHRDRLAASIARGHELEAKLRRHAAVISAQRIGP